MSDNEPVQASVGSDPLGLKPGEIFWNKYRVLGVVGKGGVSTVYRAENTENKQTVAIKVLHAHKTRDEELVRRFVREAQMTTKLEHPHAIKVYEWGIDSQERPFMIIEYLNGETLGKRIQKGNGLNYQKAVEIMEQICGAVAEAHGLGIIHRDLKPDNIMLVNHNGMEDYVKVVDFGIAKLEPTMDDPGAVNQASLTRAGAILGTPLYMSPEQLRGRKADARSDIYALGVITYEMLTGKPPFQSRNTAEVVVGHLNVTPEAPPRVRMDLTIPDSLSDVVMRALAKDPWQRPTTVQEFSNSLLKSVGQGQPRSGDQLSAMSPSPTRTPTPHGMSVDPAARVCPQCMTVATGGNFRYCLKCGADNTGNWLPHLASGQGMKAGNLKAEVSWSLRSRRVRSTLLWGALVVAALLAVYTSLTPLTDLSGRFIGVSDHELFAGDSDLDAQTAKKLRFSRVDLLISQHGNKVSALLNTKHGQVSMSGDTAPDGPMATVYELQGEEGKLGGKLKYELSGRRDRLFANDEWTLRAEFEGAKGKTAADSARLTLTPAKGEG